MSAEPLVSVVIPAFNAQDYIAETLDSIRAQSYQNIEICVVDDGSSDDTAAVVQRYGASVRYFYQTNSGGCSSPRNTGIGHCKGEYLTFLDADDLMTVDRIARQVDFLCRHPGVGLVFSDYNNFNSGGRQAATHFQECPKFYQYLDGRRELVIDNACELLAEENFGISGSFMLSRSLLQWVPGFDESLKACEDFNFYYRLARLTSAGIINEVGMLRRLHENNMTNNSLKMLEQSIKNISGLLVDEKNPVAKRRLRGNLALNQSRLARYHANRRQYLPSFLNEWKAVRTDPGISSLSRAARGAIRTACVALGLHVPNDK